MTRRAGDPARGRSLRLVRVLAWLLLGTGLVVLAVNPWVPPLVYAILWLPIMIVARMLVAIVPARHIAVDVAVLVLCVVGLDFGGFILVPSALLFLVDDRPPRTASSSTR